MSFADRRSLNKPTSSRADLADRLVHGGNISEPGTALQHGDADEISLNWQKLHRIAFVTPETVKNLATNWPAPKNKSTERVIRGLTLKSVTEGDSAHTKSLGYTSTGSFAGNLSTTQAVIVGWIASKYHANPVLTAGFAWFMIPA